MWLLPVLFLLVIQGHFCTCEGKKVRGTLGGTLTVRCAYGQGWESYKKWLCRGNDWNSCKILVKTTGSEQLVKKGQVSIQDNHSRRTFTMTLEDLQQDDADTYWCGIEQFGTDVGIEFSVIVNPAPDPTDSPKPVASTRLPSWTSSRPFPQGINSSQPMDLNSPLTRSGTIASTVEAEKRKGVLSFHHRSSAAPVISPVWILLVPPFLATFELLCQG
ncbi:CMRF35-like molecule 5 [Lynx canadensis]|uniref:CMRF35-like molecule 5 n=1 Tax=Lynx canadensis TaxID=61383 RepID=UPI0011AFE103|nr:CMRF35-like molecule 5 [Lynx canadensis]